MSFGSDNDDDADSGNSADSTDGLEEKKQQRDRNEESDEEGGQDEEKFIKLDRVIADLSELTQEYKGFGIDLIGKKEHLSKLKQIEIDMRANQPSDETGFFSK